MESVQEILYERDVTIKDYLTQICNILAFHERFLRPVNTNDVCLTVEPQAEISSKDSNVLLRGYH